MYNKSAYNSSLYNRYVEVALSTSTETLTLDSTLNIVTGEVIIIDTDAMTLTSNGTQYTGYVEDGSVFFKLLPGINTIVFTGAGTVDIEITQKDRWL